jgi:hypothetical protein
MPTIDRIHHWMTFGTFGQQRYFVYPTPRTYRGVIINANMAAHAPAGLGAFLVEKTGGLPYIIDPLTHAFQHDPALLQNDEGELKSSFDELATRYGGPLREHAGTRPLLPSDFKSGAALQKVVTQCLDFQQTQLANSMATTDAMKYLDETEESLRPYALVAPYFYMTETTLDRWLPVCSEVAGIAASSSSGNRVFSAVVVSQGVATSERARRKIIDKMADVPVSGFFLWVDDLDEVAAGSDELRGLVDLARGLRGDAKREVINLHGGYFSVLAAGRLGSFAMSGVSHGPEFGEHRSVIPVGGGIPIARYYIPCLHSRVRYRDTLRLLRAKGWLSDAETFHSNVCRCDECVATVDGRIENFREFGRGTVKPVRRGTGIVRIEYPTEETKRRCLRHYLQSKAIEYQFSATASPDLIRDDLRKGVSAFRDIAGLDQVAHLELWEQVLAES